VSNRKKADLLIELKEKGFTPFPKKTKVEKDSDSEESEEENTEVVTTKKGATASDYEYLLSMAIGCLTREKVQQLLADKDRLTGEVDYYGEVTAESLWTRDLVALERELDVRIYLFSTNTPPLFPESQIKQFMRPGQW